MRKLQKNPLQNVGTFKHSNNAFRIISEESNQVTFILSQERKLVALLNYLILVRMGKRAIKHKIRRQW